MFQQLVLWRKEKVVALLGFGLLGAKDARVVPMDQKLEKKKNLNRIILGSVQWGCPGA